MRTMQRGVRRDFLCMNIWATGSCWYIICWYMLIITTGIMDCYRINGIHAQHRNSCTRWGHMLVILVLYGHRHRPFHNLDMHMFHNLFVCTHIYINHWYDTILRFCSPLNMWLRYQTSTFNSMKLLLGFQWKIHIFTIYFVVLFTVWIRIALRDT